MPALQLVDASLRAGQEALLVSRLRRRHAVDVITLLDGCGFAALEVFGGATFEAQLRFLAEDPFERLRELRAAASKTPLMATLGGQSLVAHHHVADDVVDLFVRVAADGGIDIFRCYDPLNDARNLQRCVNAVHAVARKAEGVILCSDGDEAAVKRAASMAKELAAMGYDQLCLHDPLGILSAQSATATVRAIGKATKLPLALSFSAQTGQADFAYAAAIAAGVSRVDVALAPLAGGASFPAAEALIAAYRGSDHDTGLDLDTVSEASHRLDEQVHLYAELFDSAAARLDTSALRGLLPASAMGAALSELRARDAMDRIGEVEEEVQRVRRELGEPPMMSPIAEIVATQAVYNVCEGDRYATVSQEIKDYMLGLYGRAPSAIDANVRAAVSGRDEPITLRPADLLEAAVESGRSALEREAGGGDDAALATYLLFPAEALALQRGDVEAERLADEPKPAAAAGPPSDSKEAAAPGSGAVPAAQVPADARDLTVEVDGQSYTVRVIGAGLGSGGGAAGAPAPASAPGKPAINDGTVVAPMQGQILKVSVAVGDTVELGDVVAVLEAMKMQNDITAVKSGHISQVYVAPGGVVAPHDPVVQID